MDMIAEMSKKVNEVFDENFLEQLARESCFLQRKRKLLPQQFLISLMRQRIAAPKSSLEQLACEYEQNCSAISKQALHKKFNEAGTVFMRRILEELLTRLKQKPQVHFELLKFVRDVKIVDSSEIRLNSHLNKKFPQVRNQGAALKIQALMSELNEAIYSLELRPSKEPDQSYKSASDKLQAGDLYLSDLGYFQIETFKKIADNQSYFLSRYFTKTHAYDAINGDRIELRSLLKEGSSKVIEQEILLGEEKFPCRLVAIRLPEEAYQKRLCTIVEKKRKDPRSKIVLDDVLHRWTLFVTNLPNEVEAKSVLEVYRLRWQIELLFKMMKTFLQIKKIESSNEYSAVMSIYVSLILVALLSMTAMTIVGTEISLYKASQLLIYHLKDLLEGIIHKKRNIFIWFREMLRKFALKERRKQRQSTKQRLYWRAIDA